MLLSLCGSPLVYLPRQLIKERLFACHLRHITYIPKDIEAEARDQHLE
jgi:hypothetical protein